METYNEEAKARPIEELLKLDTFQGMSDVEIATVVEYQKAIALKDAKFQQKMDAIARKGEAEAKAYGEIADHAKAKLEELIAAPLALTVIDESEV